MQSSPIRQTLLCFLVFLAVGYALLHITQPGKKIERPQPSLAATQEISAWLSIQMAHQADSIIIKQNNRVIYNNEHPDLQEETDVMLSPQKPYSLEVITKWPKGTPHTALTISLEPEKEATLTETKWSSDDSIHDIYIFTSK